MAIWTYINPTLISEDNGVVVVADASRIVTNYPNGTVETISGAGITYSGGAVSGGIFTSLVGTLNGQNFFSVTGFTASASMLWNAVLSDDSEMILDLLLYGNDQVFGSIYSEALAGWTGADTIIALDGNDTVDGGEGADDVNGNVGMDLVYGGGGADFVRGGRDNDSVFGDAGNDPHVNGNIGDDSVSGGAGNDSVYGGQGQDTLYGDDGADMLSGDLGFDILVGGAGADRFVVRPGGQLDWVADFNFAAGDRVQLSRGTTYTVSSISSQVVIDLGGGDQLGIAGALSGTFSAEWVVFV